MKHLLTLSAGERKLSDGEEIVAALAGGAASGLVCSPTELIMIQQQRHGGTMLGVGASIVRQQGAAGLMRGLTPTIARESVFCGGPPAPH